MKIGIYDPYLDDLGGGEKYMMMLASCLAKEHEVTIFWNDESDLDAFKRRFNLPLENIKRSDNIFTPQVSFLYRAQVSRQFDILIILSDGSIPFVFSKKLYLHIQQPLPQTFSSFKDALKRKRITGIFYNSKFTKKYNDPLFPGVKATIIYPPVSIGISGRLESSLKKNYIMHVGRFRVKNIASEDYKKQGFLVEAFKKLVDQGLKNWTFILASSVKEEDKDKFQALRDNAKGYPIEFRVNKTNSELFELYKKAKIYWHASGYGEDLKEHPEMAEHFGITTVEAMGSGVVPVVINSGGQSEIVTDGKDGLLWNTLDELLMQTQRAAKDVKLWQKLSAQAMIRAQDFTEERFCSEVHKLITL